MLVPRLVRNLWHNVEGVFTKYVDEDDALTDSIDLTGDLDENQSVSAATFEDVSGVTLGTPAVSDSVVSFTHTSTGSATLQAVIDFAAYLAGLLSDAYALGGGITASGFYVDSVGGSGASAGDAVTAYIAVGGVDYADGAGKFVSIVGNSGATIEVQLDSYSGAGRYASTMVSDLAAADDHLFSFPAEVVDAPIGLMDSVNGLAEYADALAFHASETTRVGALSNTVHKKLAFVDPSTSDTDYTP